jgi:acyl carrier protein
LPEAVLSAGGEGYEGPVDELEGKLCGIYGAVLGLEIEAVGVNDDFFRLGGNSILAIRLASRITEELGIAVEVAAIFIYTTVRKLYRQVIAGAVTGEPELLTEEGLTAGFDPYIIVNETPYENRKVLFMLPPGEAGGESYLNNIIPNLHGTGIIAFNNYYTHIRSKLSKEECNEFGYEFFAEYYITQIKQIQPVGPYYLFGRCSGGVLAFEIARQLTEMGDQVEKLVLLDSFFNMSEGVIKAMIDRPDKNINYRYKPLIKNKFVANKIILFKVDRIENASEKTQVATYYASTADNHLRDLVGTDNLEVIPMNEGRSSWTNSKWIAKISAVCRLNADIIKV